MGGALTAVEGTRQRTALVTGGSRGIGAQIVRTLARDGMNVVICCTAGVDAAQAVAAQAREYGVATDVLVFDVRDAARTHDALAAVMAKGHIDVLVNNAGIVRDGLFPGLTAEDWNSVVDTTLSGFYNVTRPLIMPMARKRWGRIINVSSIAGVIGNRGQVNYAAAKAGLIGATKALAREFAKRGVTVNAVAPGLIDTDMLAGAPVEVLVAQVPMQRVGAPSDVAELVGFLASDRASYLTGQVIAVSGGL